jgi:hypothetical protein
MNRSELQNVSDWKSKENTTSKRCKAPKSIGTTTETGNPRRVTLEEPCQNSTSSIPKRSSWTPDEMERRSDRSEMTTPNHLQSPAFSVHQYDEMRLLKERMDRQELLMQKMMHEIVSLRQELNSSALNSTESERKKEHTDYSFPHSREDTPRRLFGRTYEVDNTPRMTTGENLAYDLCDLPQSLEPNKVPPALVSQESPGAKFVAEFSELIELETGQHALLASILDRNLYHRQATIAKFSNV